MKNLTGEGVDSAKEKELVTLKKNLENKTKSVRDESDVEKIKLIVEKMEEIKPSELTSTDEERFKVFQNNYFPNAVAERDEFKNICQSESMEFNYERPMYFRKFPKLGFAAVLVIILVSVSSTVIVATFGVFNPIIEWTNEKLNKSYQGNDSTVKTEVNNIDIPESEYSGIEEEQSKPILKPNYLPKGFQLSSIEKNETQFQTNYNITYLNGDKIISYVLKFRLNGQAPSSSDIEITSEVQEEVIYNDIKYYIFKNNNWYGATWDYLNVDYKSIGFETKEEVMDFIGNLEL